MLLSIVVTCATDEHCRFVCNLIVSIWLTLLCYVQDVSAPLAALIYCSEPIWGAFFAWTILGEHWGSTGWVGAFLIVASSLGAQLNTGDKVPEEERPSVEKEVFDVSEQ